MPKQEPIPSGYYPLDPSEIVQPGDLYLSKKGWAEVPRTDVGFKADWAPIIRKKPLS